MMTFRLGPHTTDPRLICVGRHRTLILLFVMFSAAGAIAAAADVDSVSQAFRMLLAS